MRLVLLIKLVFLLLLNGAAFSYAHAASLAYEFNRVSNNSAEDLGRQLGMLVTEQPGGALFTFSNRLGVPSSITDIYFDDAQPGLFRSIAYHADSGVGVSFDSQAAPANLPGGNAIGFLAGYSGDANAQSLEGGVATKGVMKNGVNNPDEWVSFLGLWANAGSFDGLIAAFADGHFRVGLHVQAIGLAGQSDSYVSQPSPVPLPAAVWLFASALFGFIVVASRRKV